MSISDFGPSESVDTSMAFTAQLYHTVAAKTGVVEKSEKAESEKVESPKSESDDEEAKDRGILSRSSDARLSSPPNV
jgi:hypothetical protein